MEITECLASGMCEPMYDVACECLFYPLFVAVLPPRRLDNKNNLNPEENKRAEKRLL